LKNIQSVREKDLEKIREKILSSRIDRVVGVPEKSDAYRWIERDKARRMSYEKLASLSKVSKL
jgi:hypothetical protein